MYDGNETLSILTALADKIDCLRGSLECFVHEASVFDIPGVRPILCSCCSSCFNIFYNYFSHGSAVCSALLSLSMSSLTASFGSFPSNNTSLTLLMIGSDTPYFSPSFTAAFAEYTQIGRASCRERV